MLIASNSASINQALPTIMNGTLGLFAIITSAFLGVYLLGYGQIILSLKEE